MNGGGPAKRLADRLLPQPGSPAAVYLAAVAVLLAIAPHLPARAGLGVTGIVALGGSAGTVAFVGVLGVDVLVEAATDLIGGNYTFHSSHRPTPMALPSTPSTVSVAARAAAQQSSSPATDRAARLS